MIENLYESFLVCKHSYLLRQLFYTKTTTSNAGTTDIMLHTVSTATPALTVMHQL